MNILKTEKKKKNCKNSCIKSSSIFETALLFGRFAGFVPLSFCDEQHVGEDV